MKARLLLSILGPLVAALAAPVAWAQYNEAAGENVPTADVEYEYYDSVTGTTHRGIRQERVEGDEYGNARGNQYDLAVDGAFEGQTVLVLHLYTQEGFDFSLPEAALREKGFGVYRYINGPPEPEEFRQALSNACQFWLISSERRTLNEDHLAAIVDFFNSGRGVYIWGDNEPYYADANYVAQALFGVTMSGNLMGDTVVTLQTEPGMAGLLPSHLITTGLEFLYEGITIATIADNDQFEPLLYGSANNLVAAVYDHDGRRAILDGGFTRLYINWDTAGTARYVKNAGAWLANWERFGDEVVASDLVDSVVRLGAGSGEASNARVG